MGVSDIISVVACLLAVWDIEPAEQANSLEGRKEGRKERRKEGKCFHYCIGYESFFQMGGLTTYRRGVCF